MKIEDVKQGMVLVLRDDLIITGQSKFLSEKLNNISAHYKNSYTISKFRLEKRESRDFSEIKRVNKGTSCLVHAVEKNITHSLYSYVGPAYIHIPRINTVVNVFVDGMMVSILKKNLRYVEPIDTTLSREHVIMMSYVVNVCVPNALDADVIQKFKKHIKTFSDHGYTRLVGIHTTNEDKKVLNVRDDKIKMLKDALPDFHEYIVAGDNDGSKKI
jgi:hypothetical protein